MIAKFLLRLNDMVFGIVEFMIGLIIGIAELSYLAERAPPKKRTKIIMQK